jgi:HK97 family phage major capsid protein
LDAEAAELEALLSGAIHGAIDGKAPDASLDLKDLGRRISAVKEAKADLDRQEESHKAAETDPRIVALKSFGGDLGTEPAAPVTKRATGAQLSPTSFSDGALKHAYQASKNRQGFRIEAKGYSTVDSLLPAQLAPGVLGHIHEWRILERLPAISISAPSYEFIVHNFAGDSGGPGIVAEGGTKPEYVPATTSSTATASKIAMHTAISWETLRDFDTWQGYVVNECFRQIQDFENAQLLYGNGESGELTGFFNTSGILTRNATTDIGNGLTGIDTIEAAINQLRVGSALAEPDLLITSPSTWSFIRRQKTTTDAYLIGDPMRDAVNRIWGLPVLVTTACTDGEALLLDTSKFGTALIREGIVMTTGYANSDLIENLTRYVFDERIALAVERPQAVLAISNLATS